MWNKWSNVIFKFFPVFCILETIISICITLYTILTNNIIAYYLLDTIVFAIVTKNICCGGIKLKTIRYNLEELREHFDNNNNSVSAISTIEPIIVAMFLSFNFSIMLWLATLGNAIDNIFYIFVYYKTLKMSVNEMTEI